MNNFDFLMSSSSLRLYVVPLARVSPYFIRRGLYLATPKSPFYKKNGDFIFFYLGLKIQNI